MPPRRSYGDGSAEPLPSGRWRARILTPDGRISLGSYPTEAEALAVALAASRQVAARAAAPVPASTLTLADWGTKWLERRDLDGVRGLTQERSVWRAHIAPRLGSLPLREITRPQVVRWLADVRATMAQASARGGAVGAHAPTTRPVSRQTVLHALRVLRGALRAARDAGHLHTDPTDGVTVPRGRQGRTEDAWTYLTPAEITAVEGGAAIPDPERAIYTVAIYTGLRQGELWALRWEDVALDGDHPEITVRASHAGPTKSGKVRRVPLLPVAVAALRRLPLPHAGLVFPGSTGGRRAKSDDARWAPAMREGGPINGYRLRAGITRRVRFHDLRHTCASHLVMGTWGPALSLLEVAQWLGHSSIAVTQRYAHLCPDRLAAKIRRGGGGGEGGQGGAGGPAEGPGRGQSGGPEIAHTAHAPLTKTPCFQARPARLERATRGLEGRGNVEGDQGLTGDRGRSVGAAVALLTLAARGEPLPRADAVTLARDAIAEGLCGALALAVLDRAAEDAPTLGRAVVDLAAAILGAAGAQARAG